jgi:GMP synthase (glutamine-hydrolysing)
MPAHPRLLLVQIRKAGPVRREEVESFARHGGLDPDRIDVLNVFDEPAFAASVADNYDALLVGGASEASVRMPLRFPFVPPLLALLDNCIEARRPVFASCFGYQAAVLGLGGTVLRDEVDFEMGTVPLTLTVEAAEDLLFSDAPDGLLAVSCHQERAAAAPSGCTALAYTEACNHSFRVDGAPFWAFQFHPELDRQRFVERLAVFKDQYTDTDDHYQRTVDRFRETPESNALVRKFIERVL